MLKTYEKAEQTITWLGPDDEVMVDVVQATKVLQETSVKEELTAMVNTTLKPAVEAVMQTPWFSRMWIRQEALGSRQLILTAGMASLPFDEFFAVIELLEQKFAQPIETPRSAKRLYEDYTTPDGSFVPEKQEKSFEYQKHAVALRKSISYFCSFLQCCQDGRAFAVCGARRPGGSLPWPRISFLDSAS